MAKNKRKFKKSVPSKTTDANATTPKTVAQPFVSKLSFPDVSSPLDEQLRKIFWGLAALFFVITVTLALNSGINGDDSFQNDYSDQLVDWYLTMGQDTSAFYHPKGPIQYYGGVYEIPTGVVNRVLGLDVNDVAYHKIRHFFNALFGILAMIFCGLFARQIGGWRAGIIGLVLIFLSPRFLGHSLMNPKDIPFAAGYIMAIYFLAKLLQQLPKPSNNTLFGLAGGVAIAFGTRAGGLILLPYIIMFIGLAFLLKNGITALFKNIKLTSQYIAYGIVPIITGLLLGILFWPYAMVDPFNHIPESLSGLTKYAINIRMLFEGEMIFGKDVPSTYLPIWIFNTVPLFIHLGILLVIGLSWKLVKTRSPLLLFLALFTALFPVAYVIFQNSTLYDGWRHLQFAYLPLVALVAIGWDELIHLFERKKILTEENKSINKLTPAAYAAIGILAITALEPAWFTLKNKDYPYVYFNPIAGGIDEAFGEYETDYWGTSMQSAMEWLEDEGIISENMQDTVIIASNFSYQLDRYFAKKYNGKVKTTYVRYRQRYDKPWDYGLFLSRFVRGSHLNNGTWPPTDKTVHVIAANNIPLLAIMKEENRNTHLAVMAGKQKNYKEVLRLLETEVVKYPQNEIAWLEIARAYTSLDTIELAYDALERVLELEPENVQAANLLGLNYINAGQVQQGVQVFENSLIFEPRNFIAHFYIASVQNHANNLKDAHEHIREAIKINPKFPEAYELLAQILDKNGEKERAQRYRQTAAKVRSQNNK